MIKKEKLIPIIIFILIFISLFIINNNKNKNKNKNKPPVSKNTKTNVSTELIQKEPTKLEDSFYNTLHPSEYMNYMRTSEGLTKADLAWHAVNTYGWNCSEVKAKSSDIKTNGKEFGNDPIRKEIEGFYYFITCSNNEKYRVYPRIDYYPIITNSQGGFY